VLRLFHHQAAALLGPLLFAVNDTDFSSVKIARIDEVLLMRQGVCVKPRPFLPPALAGEKHGGAAHLREGNIKRLFSNGFT
jgi:hypothetical protein